MRRFLLVLSIGCLTSELRADPPPPPALPAGRDEVPPPPPPPARAAGRSAPPPPARAAQRHAIRPAPPPPARPAPPPPARAGGAVVVHETVVAAPAAAADVQIELTPPAPPPPTEVEVDAPAAPPPPASTPAPAPLVAQPAGPPSYAPQPSFGFFETSFDLGGGPAAAPDGTPLSAGAFEMGVNGAWSPTRFAALKLRASFFDQPDRAVDQNGDQQDDVDERNLLGVFLGGGLRLRLPLYAGVDADGAARFLFFSEGLAGYQGLAGYDAVRSGAALEITNGLQISHVRRRDGHTRGLEMFVRYRRGLEDENRDLWAVILGLGYATEWSAYVPAVPPPDTYDAEAEVRGEPLGFSLRMGGECAGGEGWHVAKTVGWAPWRLLELELQTSYFSKDVSEDANLRDEPNVHGFFAGVGPRFHLYTDEAAARLGVWAAARFGWAQTVAEPEGHDGSGLALNVAAGVSFGGASHPYSSTEVSLFLARQNGLSGNDDDIGMWMAGLAIDYELGPHAPPVNAPAPVPVPEEPVRETVRAPTQVEVARAPDPVEVEVVRPATRTELTIEPIRPSRPWPVGFAIGVDGGYAIYPLRLAGGFQPSGLSLGLGAGFVASPYFEIRTRMGLLTRADAVENGGDDVEAWTITGGPRVRIPIRTVKDNQVALFFEALAGWMTTSDAAGASLGSGAVLDGAVGVRLPARGGLTAAVRGLLPLSDETRDLTNVQLTLGGELEMGPTLHPVRLRRTGDPAFRRAVRLPRVEVPERIEVEGRLGQ